MNYDEDKVEKLYQENLRHASRLLASLPVADGREPSPHTLSGWVYEQTIRHCLCAELAAQGLSPKVEEQMALSGRAKVDLLVGTAAVEIKALGSFGHDAEKYTRYRAKAESKGWAYLYVTRCESYEPYRLATVDAFGKARAFFLDTAGDWERFVREVANHAANK